MIEDTKTAGSPLEDLISAKEHSDKGDYGSKTHLVRNLLHKFPKDFVVDTPEGQFVGITHVPTGFKMHISRAVVPLELFKNQREILKSQNDIVKAKRDMMSPQLEALKEQQKQEQEVVKAQQKQVEQAMQQEQKQQEQAQAKYEEQLKKEEGKRRHAAAVNAFTTAFDRSNETDDDQEKSAAAEEALMEKLALYWTDDLTRDIMGGRHYDTSYLTGELSELGESVKNLDWENFKEEMGDTAYAAQMLAGQKLGINLPVVGADKVIKKFYNRIDNWKKIFADKNVPFSVDYLKGGSNYAKPEKIQKAFELAGKPVSEDEAKEIASTYGSTAGIQEEEQTKSASAQVLQAAGVPVKDPTEILPGGRMDASEDITAKPKDPNIPTTGPAAIAYRLKNLDLAAIEQKQRDLIKSGKVSKRSNAVKTLNILEGFKRNNLTGADLTINKVPVIPPVFRPFRMAGSTFVPGDANELYRDLFTMKKLHKEVADELGDENAGDARMGIYNAVKAVYGFGDPVNPKTASRGVTGFFKKVTGTNPKYSFVQRQLLSKPQDTVSRGTITINPDLTMNQVGVPKDMAWKMYSSYVQRRLVNLGYNPGDAIKAIKDQNDDANRALQMEVKERPVIVSRAPAWHKFNAVAAHPVLVDGNTVEINPFITTGMNADFDGDAMNVHVPASDEAVKEAYEKLMPSKMLFSIRDPDKVMPNLKHEQILSLYGAVKRPATKKWKFNSETEALRAIKAGDISLSDEVEYPGL